MAAVFLVLMGPCGEWGGGGEGEVGKGEWGKGEVVQETL